MVRRGSLEADRCGRTGSLRSGVGEESQVELRSRLYGCLCEVTSSVLETPSREAAPVATMMMPREDGSDEGCGGGRRWSMEFACRTSSVSPLYGKSGNIQMVDRDERRNGASMDPEHHSDTTRPSPATTSNAMKTPEY